MLRARLQATSCAAVVVAFLAIVIPVDGAKGQNTVLAVRPAEGATIPTNAIFWFSSDGQFDQPVPLVVTQSGSSRTVQATPGECCIFQAVLAPLTPGEARVEFGSTPTESAGFNYSVAGADDSVGPTVGAPIVTVELASMSDPDMPGYRVEADAGELEDDFGVATVVFEFDHDELSNRNLVPVPQTDFVATSPLLLDEIAAGRSAIYPEWRDGACVRITAVDIAGNAATSEVTCVEFEQISATSWLVEWFGDLFCSCSSSSSGNWEWGPVAVLFSAAILGRRSRMSRGRHAGML